MHVPNSLACRLEASTTHNVISEIVIGVYIKDLAIIMLGYDTTRWWGGGEVPSELQRMRVV